MEGKRLIRSIKLTNFLSFGSEGEEIELQPLNVLIGPNASGKSNFIEAFAVLRAAPTDLAAPFREGGGVREWLWKGSLEIPTAEIEAIIEPPSGVASPLRYRLCFTEVGWRIEVVDEVVEDGGPVGPGQSDGQSYYRYLGGQAILSPVVDEAGTRVAFGYSALARQMPTTAPPLLPTQSVLSLISDPFRYPELTYVGLAFGRVHLYREWNLSRYAPARLPQPTDQTSHSLAENAANLGLLVSNLELRGIKRTLLDRLKTVHQDAEELTVVVQGGTVQIYLRERGLHLPVPAQRISDGTLRSLCLLSILCHPEPPPLVCIEEPELGLHPDAISDVAELLIEASQRTQLIVTTHSDLLVSALSEVPEAVVVCERDDAGTHLRRLEPGPLQKWLEDYRLGELWTMGELGGTRW